ncbi:MAG: hypothetical protein A3B96_00245 [Candidatus Spechtbacteria bacterium RIFCSPHIGHO2_02_FULL_43_15b]|nr:MAG: hypothetical protein A3B96_00245 [Candidatus Spechtbacteria bacterium RIFCSPHIGHO2_02_FULL_43_15b]
MKIEYFDNPQRFAPFFLRLGLAGVFITFGSHKLINPAQSVFEAQLLLKDFNVFNIGALNYFLGITEVFIGVAFILGYKSRAFSILACALMLSFFVSNITAAESINPGVLRDLGLIGAAIALFLLGSGALSIDGSSKDAVSAGKSGDTVYKKFFGLASSKYFKLILLALVIFSSVYAYNRFYNPETITKSAVTGNIMEIQMRVLKNQWKWAPSEIYVNTGDKVRLFIYNEDARDHGFALDKYNVNERLLPERTTLVEFDAYITGEFVFSCSVQCGEGHYDQVGKLIVR